MTWPEHRQVKGQIVMIDDDCQSVSQSVSESGGYSCQTLRAVDVLPFMRINANYTASRVAISTLAVTTRLVAAYSTRNWI